MGRNAVAKDSVTTSPSEYRWKILSCCSAVIVACVVFSACGGGTRPQTTIERFQPTPTLSISPESASLRHSLSEPSNLQFSATVQNASNRSLIWLVDEVPGGGPSVGTISETGLYTAPRYGSPTTVTVKAVLAADNRYAAAAKVSLSCAEKLALNAPEGASVAVNGRLPITSAAEMSCYIGEPEILWTVDGTPGGTLESGFITPATLPEQVWYFPPDTARKLPVTVTAALKQSTQTKAALSINIAPTSGDVLTIVPSEISVGLGVQQQFKAFQDGKELSATWLVDGSSEADARTGWVREGMYRSPFSQPNPQNIVVTAVDVSSTPNRYASALVTVSAPGPNNNARLHGTYAVLMRNYLTLLGTVAFDGKGGVSGSAEWFGTWGIHHTGAITGTYELDWDGHAVLNVTAPSPTADAPEQQTWHLMFTSDDSAAVTAMNSFEVVGTGLLERQNLEGFSAETFSGTYVATFEGDTACFEYQMCDFNGTNSLGAIRIEPSGEFSGEVDGGSDETLSHVSGAYSMRLDGTGTATLAGLDLITDVSVVAVSKDKFLVAGLSGMNAGLGIAERQASGIDSSSLKGPYVFTTNASLARYVADGAGTLAGVFDDIAYAGLFEPPEIRKDISFSSTYAIDEYGRFTATYTDPMLGELCDIFYLIAPDRFRMMSTRDAILFPWGKIRSIGVGYSQSSPPDPATLVGRYAMTGAGPLGGASGWAFLENSGDAIGLWVREQNSFNFKLSLPVNEHGKGNLYDDFSMLPSFYAVSENKILLLGWDFTRIAD